MKITNRLKHWIATRWDKEGISHLRWHNKWLDVNVKETYKELDKGKEINVTLLTAR